MFSKQLYRRTALLTLLSRKLGASTLLANFDEVRHTLTLHVDHSALPLHKRNYFLSVLWAMLASLHIFVLYRAGEMDLCLLTLVYWFGGIMLVVNYTLFRWSCHDLCRILNGIIGLFTHLQHNYMPDFNPDSDKLNRLIERVIQLFTWTTVGFLSGVVAFCAYDPRGGIFVGWVVPREYWCLPLNLAVILFQGYVLIPIGIDVVIIGGVMFTYLYYVTVFLTKELKVGNRRPYTTSARLRESAHIRHIYRALQVLNANAMNLFGPFVFFYHCAFSVIVIYCIYVLFRYWPGLPPVYKVPILIGLPGFAGFWGLVLWMGGYLWFRGGKLLNSWKGRRWGQGETEDKAMKKFQRSCRPVLLAYGKRFAVRRVTLLSFLKGITRGTFRALLTL